MMSLSCVSQVDSLVVTATGCIETEGDETSRINTDIRITFNVLTDTVFIYWEGDEVAGGVIDQFKYYEASNTWSVIVEDFLLDWEEEDEMFHSWEITQDDVRIWLNTDGEDYQALRVYRNPQYTIYTRDEEVQDQD